MAKIFFSHTGLLPYTAAGFSHGCRAGKPAWLDAFARASG